MSKLELNKTVFNERANLYDELFWVKENNILECFIEISEPKNSDVMLDFATGTGEVIKHYSHYIETGIGIDISEKMLEIAINKCKDITNLQFEISNGLPIEFNNSTFSLVTCRNGLHHCDNWILYLKEFKRILSTNGRIIIGETLIPNENCRELWSNIVSKKDNGRNADFYFTIDQLNFILKINGFNIKSFNNLKIKTSVINWLTKGKVQSSIQSEIIQRLMNATKNEIETMQIEFQSNDIFLIRDYYVIRIE